MYVWEILLSATSKLGRHVDKLRTDVQIARTKKEKVTATDIQNSNMYGISPFQEKDESMQTDDNAETAASAEDNDDAGTVATLEAKLTGAEEVQRTMFLTLFQVCELV